MKYHKASKKNRRINRKKGKYKLLIKKKQKNLQLENLTKWQILTVIGWITFSFGNVMDFWALSSMCKNVFSSFQS